MGWETGVSLGFNALQGYEKTQTGLAQSSAIAQQADYQVANMANNTSRRIGSLQTSFLKGGIALDNLGGTNAVFQQAATQGQLDIGRTVSNANNQISNVMNSARTSALDSIASGFSKVGVQNINNTATSFGNYATDNTAYTLNDMGYGNTAYDMLDPSP